MSSQSTATECDINSRLRWRYATKKFDSQKKISPEHWAKIEESLVLTPSSFGLQPWTFVVVTNQELKAKLPEFSWNQNQVAECSHLLVICRLDKMTGDYVEAYVNHIATTRGVNPDSIAAYKNMMLGFVKGASDEKLAEWMSRQCYIALGNVMTVASMLGIDNCPMEGFLPDEYDRILGLKEKGLRSVVLCALGYRAIDDKYASLAKVRFPSDKVIHHI